jgi:endonuclease-3
MAALPVDSHHHRVAQRLGLISETLDVGPSHAVLEAQLPPGLTAQQMYDNHEVLMLHGQQCCYYRAPACHRCVVYALCPTGQRLHPEVAVDLDPASRTRSA